MIVLTLTLRPLRLRLRRGDVVLPVSCTGYISDSGTVAHDGDTCPLHEKGGE